MQGSVSPVAPSLHASTVVSSPGTAVFTPTLAAMSTSSSLHGSTPQAPAGSTTKHRLSEDAEVQGPSKRQRTDHERKEDVNMSDATSPSPSSPSFYKLGSMAVFPSRPHVGDNLMSIYGLHTMQQSVRRALPGLPDSGVKLRKSYDGKVKDLEGKVKNIARPGMLFSLLQYPDEEWQVQKVMGKELVRWDHKGNEIPGQDPADELLAKLGQATTSGPGRLPADERTKWQSLLKSDDFVGKGPLQARTEKAPTVVSKSQQYVSNSAPGSPRGVPAGPRPKRQGTKRRYHDDTFEGYGEGFVDDHLDNVSMSGVDDDPGSVGGTTMNKRRKVSSKLREVVKMNGIGSSNSEGDTVPAGLDADYQLWLASNPAALRTVAGQAARGNRRGKRGRGRGKK